MSTDNKLIWVGEVARTQAELKYIDPRYSYTESHDLAGLNTLIMGITHYNGMVGEDIVCHTYYLLSFDTGYPVMTPITSPEEFKQKVYPLATHKKQRIQFWKLMKYQFHGWSEDPRPYVE